jgi:hypothetical protein
VFLRQPREERQGRMIRLGEGFRDQNVTLDVEAGEVLRQQDEGRAAPGRLAHQLGAVFQVGFGLGAGAVLHAGHFEGLAAHCPCLARISSISRPFCRQSPANTKSRSWPHSTWLTFGKAPRI